MAVGGSSDADYWTLGAAYESGPFGLSVTYLDSERADNELQNLVIGADYALAPGLTPYAEVSFFDADVSGTTVGDNEGSVFLLGTTLNF